MRMAGEAIAGQAGIENGGRAAGTAELQGGGESGKAAADDDDVIHGDGLRLLDGGGGLGLARKYRPALRARDGNRRGGWRSAGERYACSRSCRPFLQLGCRGLRPPQRAEPGAARDGGELAKANR